MKAEEVWTKFSQSVRRAELGEQQVSLVVGAQQALARAFWSTHLQRVLLCVLQVLRHS
jgi:hypothetical protein